MATVYAVASAKGGVGKTTTTAALATILAGSGADVVAIDADLGMANLAGAVGVTPGETTLHDVLAGEAEPAAAVREGPSGLRVVPGAAALDAYAAADPSELRRVVEAFDDADYVFVDAGAGLSHDSTLPLAIADETLLVSTPERSALGDTEKTRQLTERLGGTVAGAAITRVTDDTDEVVTALLDAPVLGRIPDDETVSRAATANRPLLAVAPDAPATRAYRDLARALTGAGVDGAGLDGPAAGAASGSATDDEVGGGDESEGDDEPEVTDDAVIVDDGPKAAADEAVDSGRAEAAPGDDTIEREGEDDAAEEAVGSGEGETAGDEDIIVADPDATGVSEPGDGDDIIVASEEETADGTTDADGDERPGEAVTDDREVGGTGTDEDGMTDERGDEGVTDERDGETAERDGETAERDGDTGSDDAETHGGDSRDGDDEDAIPDADETAREAAAEREGGGESAGRSDSGPSASGDDIDEELAGSIPFRDDDTGTMNTVLSEEDAEGDEDADEETTEDATEESAAEADDVDEEEENGGFFSRLLGR